MSDDSTPAVLAGRLRTLIAELSVGDRLPSSRELIRRHGVSPVTVTRAIALLAAEGLVTTRPGSGTYVASRRGTSGSGGHGGFGSFGGDDNPAGPAFGSRFGGDTAWQTVALADRAVDTRPVTDVLGPPPPGTLRLDGGYLHRSLQPTRALAAALARAARRPDAWDRTLGNGLEPLRAVFARGVGAGAGPEDVVITAGGQNALSTAFRAVAAPGAAILVESPTYPGAIAAARAADLRPLPVPVDEHGLRPELLADAFALSGARLLYCQPTYQNPTGAVLAPDRRRQIVEVARAAGAFIVEDDFARLLGHGGPVPPPLLAEDRDGTVVYLTSLSKPAAPSLRIGALIARGPVMERLRAVRHVDDFFVSRPLQETAVELTSAPGWVRHLRTLSAALRERCAALAAALEAEIPEWTVSRLPGGGLHLWVRPTPGEDDAVLAAAARRHGVSVSPGNRYFATEPPGPFLRLGFAAAADRTELREAVRRLAAARRESAG
ncbi:PLP-dependent aminotransferase family protein [Catenulispora yoronensis]|uniref:aminotransferase-like domain-containing protein n=1 Tax=Catenulispora yoronensis TaxID=450799 RepID=UPI0031E46D40